MIKSIITILILVAILAGLSYVVYYFSLSDKNSGETNNEEVVDISNDLKKDVPENTSNIINTKKGDDFSITLKSNPTTGYGWEVSADSEYVKLIDRNFISDSDPEDEMVGVGGNEIFNFNALESGEAEITFSYLRPWEKDIEPIEKKVYNITIK